MLVLVIVTFVLIFLGGGLAADLLGPIGLGRPRRRRLADRPLAARAALRPCSSTPSSTTRRRTWRCRRFQWITPGAVFGVLTWIVASALFFLYVSNFSSYSATYGAFAGAVILLVWLWLTNVVLLLGAELNAVDRRAPLARAAVAATTARRCRSRCPPTS